MIVACAGVQSLAKGGSNTLFIGAYDTSTVTSDTPMDTWSAISDCYLTPQMLGQLIPSSQTGADFPDMKTVGLNVSIASFSVGPIVQNGPPQLYLAAFINPECSGDAAAMPFFVVLSLDESRTINSTPTACGWVTAAGSSSLIPNNPVAAVRDPAGSLLAFIPDPHNNQLVCLAYATSAAPTQTTGLALISDATLPSESTPSLDDATAPSIAYYVASLVDATSPGTELTAKTANVYQFRFYRTETHCRVDSFGIMKLIAGTSLTPTPQHPNTLLPAGIIEGPIPLPDSNVLGVLWSENQPDLGDITYGWSSSTETQHISSTTFSWGVQGSLCFTKGVGPAFDASVNHTAAQSSGITSGTTKTGELTQRALIQTEENKQSGDCQATAIMPQGALFGHTVSIAIVFYQFFDVNNNPVVDSTQKPSLSQAPSLVTIQPSFTQGTDSAFVPFVVIPGVLSSYTPEAINVTMLEASDNYFAELILPNCVAFSSTSKGIPGSWTANSTSSAGFGQFAESFTEHSWTFDTSVYGGVSGGGEFSIGGIGEEAEFSVMAGVSTSSTAGTTTATHNSWGKPAIRSSCATTLPAGAPISE